MNKKMTQFQLGTGLNPGGGSYPPTHSTRSLIPPSDAQQFSGETHTWTTGLGPRFDIKASGGVTWSKAEGLGEHPPPKQQFGPIKTPIWELLGQKNGGASTTQLERMCTVRRRTVACKCIFFLTPLISSCFPTQFTCAFVHTDHCGSHEFCNCCLVKKF